MTTTLDTNTAADLARFIAENTNHNLFLTGKAGTGKTVFLRDFVAHTKKKVVVLAPTGIAAINAKAMTIHSFCRFGLASCPMGKVSRSNDFALDDEDEDLVRNMDMIIIDEVSMVRADIMDHISEKIRLIRNSEEPFGGVQLLLIGDLYQLPPVVNKKDEEILTEYYGKNYFFFNSIAIKKVGFETICLNKVYRQNNPEFVNILNKAREGNVSWQDCNKLNERYLQDFEMPEESKYITLVAQRAQAETINGDSFKGVEGNCKTYSAKIIGEFPEDLYPTSRELLLKEHAQVMFIKNDKDDRYCNGTIGEVVELDKEKISVKVGDKIIEVEPSSWDNIRYEYKNKKIKTSSIGTFTQFPLKTAWAITIHKSQGLSFEHVIIDIPRAFAAGQAYVALSRCRSLEGMVLKKKLSPKSFFTDSLVSDFYDKVDNERHVARLADAVGYVSFEWDGKNAQETECKHGIHIERPFNETDISRFVERFVTDNYVDYHIYHLSLECGSELSSILEEIREYIRDCGFSGNPYYDIKLYKDVSKGVSKIVRERYNDECWSLHD